MTTEHIEPGFEPPHNSSPTDHVLDELQLYGYRPFQDEPDPRPLPQAQTIAGAVADIFDALIVTLGETRLEPDLEELLWSSVNLFHRAVSRIERELDDNEQAQRRGQKEQDGSEIRSVELERLTAEGMTLIERRNSFEFFRDCAAEQFERQTGSSWRPRSGSMVNHRALTSAMIDSRDFLAAKRRAETQVLLPAGPKIAFTGGFEFNDHRAIWDRLDKVHAKHPDMVLLHGGSPKGAERIAAKWADHERFRRSPSSPTGPSTPRRRRSSATTRCSTCCRSASSLSPARGSPRISPTRRGNSASRCGRSTRAARERRFNASLGAKIIFAINQLATVVTKPTGCRVRSPEPAAGQLQRRAEDFLAFVSQPAGATPLSLAQSLVRPMA